VGPGRGVDRRRRGRGREPGCAGGRDRRGHPRLSTHGLARADTRPEWPPASEGGPERPGGHPLGRPGPRADHPTAGGAVIRASLALLLVALLPSGGVAQEIDLGGLLPEGDGAATGRIIQLVALLTVLSVAPGLLIMVTSFTRFIVALSFLRSGLGVPSTPANLILISLALFMTFYVMGPAFNRAWDDGVSPLMENRISEEEAFGRIVEPFREFVLLHVREKDLAMFDDLRQAEAPAAEGGQDDDGAVDLGVLIPAVMISELRRGFEIGFLIIMPFLVMDLIVATLVMSMGMLMLPP